MSEQELCEEIASRLQSLVRPYYKGLRPSGERPEFKKSLRGDEVENLLLSLHDIIVEIKTREPRD